jgi:restriction endonuclease Mrr
MAIPDYQTLMLPVLRVGAAGETSVRECIEQLAKQFRLTDEERAQLLPSGKQTTFVNRVHWAITYMVKAGLLNQVVPAADLHDKAIEMAQMIAGNDARMVQGIKRLLHEDIALGWREQYDNEEHARATWLSAAHPREGFKDFLSRKGQRA